MRCAADVQPRGLHRSAGKLHLPAAPRRAAPSSLPAKVATTQQRRQLLPASPPRTRAPPSSPPVTHPAPRDPRARRAEGAKWLSSLSASLLLSPSLLLPSLSPPPLFRRKPTNGDHLSSHPRSHAPHLTRPRPRGCPRACPEAARIPHPAPAARQRQAGHASNFPPPPRAVRSPDPGGLSPRLLAPAALRRSLLWPPRPRLSRSPPTPSPNPKPTGLAFAGNPVKRIQRRAARLRSGHHDASQQPSPRPPVRPGRPTASSRATRVPCRPRPAAHPSLAVSFYSTRLALTAPPPNSRHHHDFRARRLPGLGFACEI
jgi:hypothetical protein